ncbi:MAG TPA: Ig-like domain-containing protein [Pirellulales bacterium]|nr:Ig-like domain-containing protein [Pirellulales bacterium]
MRWSRKTRSPRKPPRRVRRFAFEPLEGRLALSGAPPIAFNDSYVIAAGEPLSISASGVLANDTDAEGDPLAAELFSSPAHGALTLNADGSFVYAPDAGFTGIDSFVYRATDGTATSGLAAATLRVGLLRQPPALDLDADDSSASGIDFSTTFTEDGVAAPIADPDATLADPASPTIVSARAIITNRLDGTDETLAANASGTLIQAAYDDATGTLVLSGVDSPAHYLQVIKSITYRDASQHPHAAVRQVTLVVDDGTSQSAVATARIAVVDVNDPPVAADDAFSGAQNTPLVASAPAVLGNDSDADGDVLAAQLEQGPAHGSLRLAADGSFVYTPAAGFSGVDQFAYRASDGSATSNVATVTIAIAADDPAPPAAANDVFQVAGGLPFASPAAGVLANDTATGGGALSAALVIAPLHGSLTLRADGSFDYVPQAGFQGVDGFSYRAQAGGAMSDVASVTLDVLAPASSGAPVATPDSYLLGATDRIEQSADSVLSNDVPAGAGTAAVATPPQHGTLVLNSDGTFSYTPGAGFHGIDQFSYQLSNSDGDSTAAVELVSQPAELVRKLYRDILNRDPDLSAWEFWTDAIAGGQTLDQVAHSLMETDEYLDLSIRQFYHDYLHRDAEQAGLDYWRGQVWRPSGGPDQVQIGILASAELRQSVGGSASGWVTELYRRYLGREAEPLGFNYWTGHLADGSMNVFQVASGFVLSAESDGHLSAGWYDHYLRRPITAQEQADLVAQLLAGDSHREETAQMQIVATSEYRSTPPQPAAGIAQRII